MAEICTPPVEGTDENGDVTYTFTVHHTLGDIARWLMRNPGEAQDVFDMLYTALEALADQAALAQDRERG